MLSRFVLLVGLTLGVVGCGNAATEPDEGGHTESISGTVQGWSANRCRFNRSIRLIAAMMSTRTSASALLAPTRAW